MAPYDNLRAHLSHTEKPQAAKQILVLLAGGPGRETVQPVGQPNLSYELPLAVDGHPSSVL